MCWHVLGELNPHSQSLKQCSLLAACRYAWSRLFNLAKTYNKNLTPADVQQLSCNVLLSALSITPYDVSDVGHTEAELDIEKDRSIRMATILGFKVVRPHAHCQHLHPHAML